MIKPKIEAIRQEIYQVIEVNDERDRLGRWYDLIMVAAIVVSLVPLAFKRDLLTFKLVDKICMAVFIADYLMRWATADIKYGKCNVWSFVRYPFSIMALIDLVSILPSLTVLNSGFKILRMTRMVRALRVFRVVRATRYFKSAQIIVDVFKRAKESLIAVCALAVAYILIAALIVFNVEPASFRNFFDAVYWATVSLTTVGYGDIYPVTTIGRTVAMVSSLFGIAIVALPAGIITAGYMKEIDFKRDSDGETDDENEGE